MQADIAAKKAQGERERFMLDFLDRLGVERDENREAEIRRALELRDQFAMPSKRPRRKPR